VLDESTGGPGGRRGKARDERRTQAILDAVVELLAEVGYERMTTDAVAARARASKATIYRRWPTKAELVVDAVRRRGSRPRLPVPDTGTLRGDLLQHFRTIRKDATGPDPAVFRGVMQAMQHDPEFRRVVRAHLLEDGAAYDRVLLRRAIARGEIPPEIDPGLLFEVSHALITTRVVMLGEPLDDAYIDHLIDDILLPILTGSRGRGT
jgi:AcrR family transcriptional regulator